MSDVLEHVLVRPPLVLDLRFSLMGGPLGAIPLTRAEYDVLARIMEREEGASMREIVDAIYGTPCSVADAQACIRQVMARLRKKAARLGAPGVFSSDYAGGTAYSINGAWRVATEKRAAELAAIVSTFNNA